MYFSYLSNKFAKLRETYLCVKKVTVNKFIVTWLFFNNMIIVGFCRLTLMMMKK